MNKKNRYRFLSKISALVEGGHDGTLGSREATELVLSEARAQTSPAPNLNNDLYLDSYLAEATKVFDYIDLDVYILDKSFFGENEQECNNAVRVIKYLFEHKIINRELLDVHKRIQSSTHTEKKQKLFGLIEEVKNRNSQQFFLTQNQLNELDHLRTSIRKSERPFLLYIYGKNNSEAVNLNGIRHDMMHIFKDFQIFVGENHSEEGLTFEEKGDMLNLKEDDRAYKGVNSKLSKSHPLAYINDFIRVRLNVLSRAIKKVSKIIIVEKFNRFNKAFKKIPYNTEEFINKMKISFADEFDSLAPSVIHEEIISGMHKKNKIYEDKLGIENIEWSDFSHDVQQAMFFSDEIIIKTEEIIDNISIKISDLAKRIFKTYLSSHIDELYNLDTESRYAIQKFVIDLKPYLEKEIFKKDEIINKLKGTYSMFAVFLELYRIYAKKQNITEKTIEDIIKKHVIDKDEKANILAIAKQIFIGETKFVGKNKLLFKNFRQDKPKIESHTDLYTKNTNKYNEDNIFSDRLLFLSEGGGQKENIFVFIRVDENGCGKVKDETTFDETAEEENAESKEELSTFDETAEEENAESKE